MLVQLYWSVVSLCSDLVLSAWYPLSFSRLGHVTGCETADDKGKQPFSGDSGIYVSNDKQRAGSKGELSPAFLMGSVIITQCKCVYYISRWGFCIKDSASLRVKATSYILIS